MPVIGRQRRQRHKTNEIRGNYVPGIQSPYAPERQRGALAAPQPLKTPLCPVRGTTVAVLRRDALVRVEFKKVDFFFLGGGVLMMGGVASPVLRIEFVNVIASENYGSEQAQPVKYFTN